MTKACALAAISAVKGGYGAISWMAGCGRVLPDAQSNPTAGTAALPTLSRKPRMALQGRVCEFAESES